MPTETTPRDRPIAPDDPALHPGWRLLEFLLSLGADEFAVRIVSADESGRPESDRAWEKLAFAFIGTRPRECTVTYRGEDNPRPIQVWRLDQRSLDAIREVMPAGILRKSWVESAWVEDLCVYRGGGLVLGTVTHEQFAFVRLTDADFQQWKDWSAAQEQHQ